MTEEETNLWRRYREGDTTALEDLLVRHLPLVYWVVKRSKNNRSDNPGDLMQDGIAGLIDAIRRFEPDRGYEFSTYAQNLVRERVLESGEFTRHLLTAEDGTLDVASVAALSRGEITDWIRLRLHGRDQLVPGDVKQGEPSYHLFASIYPNLERDSRSYMRGAVEALLIEMLQGDASWQGEPAHSLLLLAQELGERDFIDPIRRMAENSLFVDSSTGRDVDGIHRRLLQSLVALGWRGPTQFWHAQFSMSPATYASVAFAGLNLISIRAAMELLSEVPWRDEGARRAMRVALRGLLPAYDHTLIGTELSRASNGLDPSARRILESILPEVQVFVCESTELRQETSDPVTGVKDPMNLGYYPGVLSHSSKVAYHGTAPRRRS